MARPRKDPQADKPAEPALAQRVTKSVDSRNAWISALAAIRTVVDQLLKSAIEESSELEPTKFDSGIDALNRATQLLASAQGLDTAQSAIAIANGDVKTKKEKKEKKAKDPNEPKRPATTYILFGQYARPVVQKDLGETASKRDVEAEIRNRWKHLGDAERDSWRAAYEKNKVKYGTEIAAYRATHGLPNGTTPAPDDVDPIEGEAETAAGAEDDEDDDDEPAPKKVEDSSDSDSSDDSDKEPSPPPKAPVPVPETKTPKSNKRRKTGETNGAASTPVPLPSATKQALAAAATPKTDSPKVEKKKRGPKSKADKAAEADKAAAAAAAAAATAEPEVSAPEKKNKRKR